MAKTDWDERIKVILERGYLLVDESAIHKHGKMMIACRLSNPCENVTDLEMEYENRSFSAIKS
jgi:hypothetical protein